MANPLFDDLGITPAAPTAQAANPLFADLGISKDKPAASAAPEESLWQQNVDVAKAAPRQLLEGAGGLADTASNFLENAFSEGTDKEPDHPIFKAIAKEVADRLNLPETNQKSARARIIGKGVEAAPSAFLAGPEAAADALLPTMVSGAASQGAAELGAGPVGQTVAGLAPFAPSAAIAGIRGAVRGGAEGAATMQQNLDTAQNAGLKLSAGQVAENGAIRGTETMGSKIPGGGALAETRGAGLNKQVEDSVSNITKKLAPDYNQKPPTPTAAGETIEEGIKKRKQGLKNETNEVSEAMLDAVGGKDTPVSAPNLHGAIPDVIAPTGLPEVDKLITGAKTKALAKTATAVAEQPKVPTSYTTDGEGAHVVKSPNGETHFVEQNNGDLKAWRSDTKEFDENGESLRGKGEGTARLETGAHVATSKGGNLVSDVSVSHAEAKAYDNLAKKGWVVEKNPNAERTDHSWVSDSPKNPVYTVKAPNTAKTQAEGPAATGTEKHFTGEWTYNPETNKSEPVTTEPPKAGGPTVQAKAVLNAPTPWTFDSLKQFRTSIGKAIGRVNDPVQQAQLSKMYGAASDDLRAHARSVGPEAEQAWDLFNHVASQNAATQKTLTRAVKDLGGPEATFKAAISGSKDGATKLAPVMRSLDDEGKNLFRATVLHRLGRAGGAADAPFDANTFLTNWKGMSPEGKNMLFGEGANAGPPTQLRKSLDSLSDSLDLLKKQGYIKSGFVKGVEQGSHGLKNLGILGVVALLGEHGGTAMMHVAEGHPFLAAGAAGGALGALAGNPVMSRVLTNPKTVSWLAQATKAPKGMIPVLINQLDKMGDKDPDAKDLASLIRQSATSTASNQGPKDTGVAPPQGTIYPKINRSAGMQPLQGGGYGIPPETM